MRDREGENEEKGRVQDEDLRREDIFLTRTAHNCLLIIQYDTC